MRSAALRRFERRGSRARVASERVPKTEQRRPRRADRVDRDAIATAFTASYLAHLAELDVADVRRAPCLGWGRGGVGHVLYRAGLEPGSPALLARAAAWAAAGIRSANAFRLRSWPRASYSRGLAGLHALAAMIADARLDHVARERHLARFLDVNRRARGTIDLFSGTAGRLAGVAILHARCPDPRLIARGDAIVDELIAHAPTRGGARVFSDGVAHGWPGVALGLLAYQRVARSVPAGALRRALAGVRATSLRDRGGWSHGRAGHAMLWARAHAELGDRRYLARARAEAELAFADADGGPQLVSGLAGTAYALLAVADVDPRGPWRERAWQLALRAIANLTVPDRDPYGLWGGLSGLYCLADDLARGGPARFPIIEA